MSANKPLTPYLAGYPAYLTEQVCQLINNGRLGIALYRRYPKAHGVRNERALQEYVTDLKNLYHHFARSGLTPKVKTGNSRCHNVPRNA
jgi:hypothetical protein